MFNGIPNETLSMEKVSTIGVTQENLELTLPPNSLDSHQTQNNKMKSWTTPRLHTLEGKLIHWLDKAKTV